MSGRPRRVTDVDRRLAPRLRRVREFRGLSRPEFARMLDWSPSTLFSIEVGRVPAGTGGRQLQALTVGQFIEVCHILQVPAGPMLSPKPLDLMALPEWGPR